MRRLGTVGAVVLAGGLLLSGCSDSSGAASSTRRTGLAGYTDPGDGCRQVVSAIGYLDFSLKRAGQEPYQEYTDEVRSKLEAIEGTVALERGDFPDGGIQALAEKAGRLAKEASRPGATPQERTTSLRSYRAVAAQVVAKCGRYVDGDGNGTAEPQ